MSWPETRASWEWHLDVVCDEKPFLLVAIDPVTNWTASVEIERFSALHIARGLSALMLRPRSNAPRTIVTDHARAWSGVAAALGLQWRFYGPGGTTLERIARRLMERSA